MVNHSGLIAPTPVGPGEGGVIRPSAADARAAHNLVRTQASRAEAVIDRALVERFNGGDEAAFVEIVARYRDRIHGVASSLMHNHADAEEIAQDTFIRAHRGLGRFRGDSSLATWLHRIAVNLARNRYWFFFRRRRHMSFSLDLPLNENGGTFNDLVAASDADPARQATVNEFVEIIAACMQKLEVGHREILTLRNLLHRSYEEIGHSLGINQGTVKSRIARARGKLRGLIAEANPEFAADSPAFDWFEPVRGTGRVASSA